MLEEGYHFIDNDGGGHLLDELGEVGGGLAADHGRLVVDEQAELLAELLLDGRGDLGVGSCEEAAARHLRGEPVGLGQSDCEGDKVFLDLLRGEIVANLVEGFDGLDKAGQRRLMEICADGGAGASTYFVPDDGLLDGSEVLEGRKQNVTILGATNVFHKAAQLLAQGHQDLILVFDRLCRRVC